MKNKNFKIATVLVIASVFGCVKPPICGVNPQNPGGEPHEKCDKSAQGTLEQCAQDSSLWFINVNSASSHILPVAPMKYYVPVNLPANFKINYLTVNFKFKLLPDSVPLDCAPCETYPPLFGRKIELCDINKDTTVFVVKKPNIYLYPKNEIKVDVQLNYQGRLVATYPEYNDDSKGWSVMAKSDGTLKNLADNLEYQYLFWEGIPSVPYNFNMSDGFCVKGSDTRAFLQRILPKLGLIPKEYNEMIVFWLPQMQNNPYNIIHFAGTEYTKSAPLTITPKPDKLIRVFMAFQPSNAFVKTSEPIITTPRRQGFTVVEWGGAEVPLPGKNSEMNP